VNSQTTIPQPSLTARQTSFSSSVALCSTRDDFSSHVPTAHHLCETSDRTLPSYIESVLLHPVRSWVHGHSLCVDSNFAAPIRPCSVYRRTNSTIGYDCRYYTIVSNGMAPDADDSTYLVDDRGVVSGRSCGGAGVVRLSWKFARLLVWIRWYCRGSDWGAYLSPSSRLCKLVRRSCRMGSSYPVVSLCESPKPTQTGISSYPPIAESALLANERSGRKISSESSSTPYRICGSAMRLRLWKDKGALAAARSLASLG
jgi:hypothetical protein